MGNTSEVQEFILLGLTTDRSLQHILFVLFLVLYLVCLLGNGAILTVILSAPRLHTPMYFFLGNLSCQDICISTNVVPKILSGLLMEQQTTSYIECITQLYFFHFLGCSEAFLLSVMAYDRCVAICKPLRYSVIMNKGVCLILAVAVWTAGFFYALMHTVVTSRLWFCGPHIILHFACDIKPLLELACSSITLNLTLLNVVTGFIAVAAFFVTLLSYFYIITFLFFKFQTWQSRWKAFSTCVSHLTVVTLYLVPPILNYMLPSVGNTSKREMVITLAYVIVTPVLNPLIYALRNQDVKSSLRTILHRKLLSGRISIGVSK